MRNVHSLNNCNWRNSFPKIPNAYLAVFIKSGIIGTKENAPDKPQKGIAMYTNHILLKRWKEDQNEFFSNYNEFLADAKCVLLDPWFP